MNQYSVLPSSYIRSIIYLFQYGVGSIPASMRLCLGSIAANAAAEEATRMAARARRARQFVRKEIFRCYQCIRLEDHRIYSRVYFTVLYVVRNCS